MSHEDLEQLREGIQSQLEHEWIQFRSQSHNPSNKGSSYEEGLRDFLTKYFGGVYDIHSQPVIIDSNAGVFDKFDTKRGEHEIDVVALFKQSKPQIVFDVGEMKYVPLEGTAFLCEVKSVIDSTRLEKDLKKLQKVREISSVDNRFGVTFSGSYTTNEHLFCAVYDERNISTEKLEQLLRSYPDSWDLILIVEDNSLIVNSRLPVSDSLFPPLPDIEDVPDDAVPAIKAEKERRSNMDLIWMSNSLMNFINIISVSIPSPASVSTVKTMQSLVSESQ